MIRTSRTALILAILAIVVPLIALLIGLVVSAAGPGGDTDASWAPLMLPLVALVIAVPLWIVSFGSAIYTLAKRPDERAAGVWALGLDILSAMPFVVWGVYLISQHLRYS